MRCGFRLPLRRWRFPRPARRHQRSRPSTRAHANCQRWSGSSKARRRHARAGSACGDLVQAFGVPHEGAGGGGHPAPPQDVLIGDVDERVRCLLQRRSPGGVSVDGQQSKAVEQQAEGTGLARGAGGLDRAADLQDIRSRDIPPSRRPRRSRRFRGRVGGRTASVALPPPVGAGERRRRGPRRRRRGREAVWLVRPGTRRAGRTPPWPGAAAPCRTLLPEGSTPPRRARAPFADLGRLSARRRAAGTRQRRRRLRVLGRGRRIVPARPRPPRRVRGRPRPDAMPDGLDQPPHRSPRPVRGAHSGAGPPARIGRPRSEPADDGTARIPRS